MANITEENRELYVYIGKLHRALSNAMDTVDNIYDNGENCPYCGNEYNFNSTEYIYNCDSSDCVGTDAQRLLDEVNEVCNEGIKAVGQGTLNIR